MRLPITYILVLIFIGILVDAYIYCALKKSRGRCEKALRFNIGLSVVAIAALISTLLMPVKSSSENSLIAVMWIIFSWLTIYSSKIIWIIFNLFSLLPKIFGFKSWRWISRCGIGVACVAFILMWWGALFNRFNTDIRQIDIEIANLPDSFKGYKIVQFSDLHTGTFNTDTTFVSKLVDEINAQKPDLIVFSGDIVNRRSVELKPFVKTLSRLQATDGVISILGNHDYGDYSVWPTEKAKAENMQLLYSLQKKMGWNLLRNQTQKLERGGDSLSVIGVENIGDPPFHIYGSLSKAYLNASDHSAKILLSHNPAHWVDSIANNPANNIGLTLSGHTHAMQMELFGFSPAALRYPTWGGLYYSPDKKRNLYVNIGAGEVGLPMRIGATPEITVITLR